MKKYKFKVQLQHSKGYFGQIRYQESTPIKIFGTFFIGSIAESESKRTLNLLPVLRITTVE